MFYVKNFSETEAFLTKARCHSNVTTLHIRSNVNISLKPGFIVDQSKSKFTILSLMDDLRSVLPISPLSRTYRNNQGNNSCQRHTPGHNRIFEMMGIVIKHPRFHPACTLIYSNQQIMVLVSHYASPTVPVYSRYSEVVC